MNFDRADFATNRLLRQDLSPVAEQTASIVKRRGTAAFEAEPLSENPVQSSIVTDARKDGFLHLRTSRVWRPCPHCHKFPVYTDKDGVRHGTPRGDGCSKGLPDELFFAEDWPALLMAGVEIKGPKTRISTEQQALADAGRILIARSYADVRPELLRIDEDMRLLTLINSTPGLREKLLAGVMPHARPPAEK